MIIIKRGTNASCFALKNKVTITLKPEPMLNIIPDSLYERLMDEYGAFIRPRICSDKNPKGCFIIQEKKESAQSQEKEVGALTDGSSQIDGETLQKAEEEIETAVTEFQKEKKLTKRK